MHKHRSFQIRPLFTVALMGGALLLSGCVGEPAEPADSSASLLRAHFPAQAEHVLGRAGSFLATGHGFSAIVADDLQGWRGLAAELPADGEGALALKLPGGGELRVHELGAQGPAEQVERAITYRRARGTSFWTVVPGGVEEWLQLEAGALDRSGLAASWSIEGASARQAGDAVEIADAAGVVRVRVSAPAAFAAGGRAIGARLRVEGATIALYVDPTGEEVLVDPLWIASASMAAGRLSQASVRLADGRVLVTGGFNSTGYLSSAEIYDPAISAWRAAGSMIEARGRHTMSLLPSGQVLVVGGYVGSSTPTGVELYDPASDSFSSAGSLPPRFDHTATTLTDGRILLAGGNSGNAILADGLVYDPATATFSATGPISKGHQAHRATRLADGRVLLTGNYSGISTTDQMVADIYNPATNTWAKAGTGFMKSARYTHVAGLLADGRVIIAGGGTGFNGYSSSAEIYSPATNTFTTVATMGTARAQASGMMLPDGTFLVAGGYSGAATLATTQRYDPATNTWISAGSMLNPHYGASTEMLPGNYVLVAAGNGGSVNTYSSFSDQYSPLGALGVSCGAGAECGSGLCVDGVCCDTACDGGDTDCRACSVAAGGAQNGVCGWVVSNVNACAPSCITFQRGTLGTVLDTHIIAGSPTGNFGTATLISLGLSGTERQALFAVDVSSIDPATLVTSATLLLKAGGGVQTVLRAHEILAPWGETTVTWNSFAGAYAPAVLASSTYTAATGLYALDLTASVKGWVNGSAVNNGVLVERNLDGTNSLYASNHGTAANRPKLQVCTMAHP